MNPNKSWFFASALNSMQVHELATAVAWWTIRLRHGHFFLERHWVMQVDGFLQLELHMQSNVTLERKSQMYLGIIIISSMKNPRSNSKSNKENSFWSFWNTTISLMEDLDTEILQQTCIYLSFRWQQYYCGSHDLHGTEHCRLQVGWHRHAAPETVSIPKWVQQQEQQQQHEEEDEEENPNYPPENEHRPKSWESPRSL